MKYNKSLLLKLSSCITKKIKHIGLVLLTTAITQTVLQAQIQPKLMKKPDFTQKTTNVTTQKERIDTTPNFKRISFSELATAKNVFATLQQGDYSIINLTLPGNATALDYYVQKQGTKLILNGDIVVADFALMSTMSYTRNDDKPIVGKNDLYRWDGGNVPVVLDNSVFESDYYNIIKSALDFFNFNTGIVFKERTNEVNWLVIKCIPDDESGKGGSSAVGRQRNGSNILELVKGNFDEGTVLHELMHALGVWHEQGRQDRDNFIEIKWDNIKEASAHNFQKEGNSTARSAYDYCSIMHYPSFNSFAKDKAKPTIVCKNNGSVTACPPCLGNRVTLSKQDLDGLDQFYRGIGVSRFPSKQSFIASNVPVAGCLRVSDDLIKSKWNSYNKALGDCVTGVITLGISNSSYVQFQKGEIYHTPSGVFVVHGDIYLYFKSENGLGKFGLPVRDEEDLPNSNLSRSGYNRISKFEKGVIVWGPNKNATFYSNESYERAINQMILEKATPELGKKNPI